MIGKYNMTDNTLKNNETSSTQGEDTQVQVDIEPYFPTVAWTVPKNVGGAKKSWLPPAWGDYGHNRASGKRSHGGCDVYADEGTKVVAVKSGTIIAEETVKMSAGWGGAGAITIDHGDFIIRYGEVKNIKKTSGNVVQGEHIADVDNTTFYPKQAMLHLEMYDKTATGPLTQTSSKKKVNGRPIMRREDSIDPTPFLEKWLNNMPPKD